MWNLCLMAACDMWLLDDGACMSMFCYSVVAFAIVVIGVIFVNVSPLL